MGLNFTMDMTWERLILLSLSKKWKKYPRGRLVQVWLRGVSATCVWLGAPRLQQHSEIHFLGAPCIKGRVLLPNQMNFRKSANGGGGSFSIVLRKIKTRHTLKKALVVIPVYGTGQGTKTDEFSERFQMAVDPHTLPLRMVPITGNHVHAFHTIWPLYLLAYPL